MQRLFNLVEKLQIFKYGIAAILVAVPLYPKFPLFGVPGTYVAVRLEDFFIFSLGLVFLLMMLHRPPSGFWQDKLNQALFLFFAAGLLSVISAIFLTQTVLPHLAILHFLRRIEYVLPFFIAATAMRTGNIRFFAETLFVTTFFAFLYGLGQQTLGFPVISTQHAEYAKGVALRWSPDSRLSSTFAGHYDLAAFLVMVLPIMFAYLFAYKSLFFKLVMFVVVILPSLWLFFEAESRVSLVSFLIAITVTLWIIKKKIFILPVVAFCLVWAVFFSGLGDRYRHTLDVYWQRLMDRVKIMDALVKPGYAQEVLDEPASPSARKTQEPANLAPPVFEDRSTSIRLQMEWPRAIRAFVKNPLLGTGYSSITLATDNDYLRLLGEVGLVGTLSFFLVLMRLLVKFIPYLVKSLRLDFNKAFVAGFCGGFVGFLVNATFIDVFEASKTATVFWTLCGLCVGVVRQKENG